MAKCFLKRDVEAEGEVIRQGEICEIEKVYPDENGNRGFADLFNERTGALFWVYLDELEEVK